MLRGRKGKKISSRLSYFAQQDLWKESGGSCPQAITSLQAALA